MFNYKCEECLKGIVRDVEKKNHKVTVDGVDFHVPTAIIGVCDHCGAINYSGEEMHRWHDLFKAWQVKSDKYISPAQIKQIREKLGLNQSQFADFLGISRQSLSAWESEKRAQVQPMNVDITLRILLSEIGQEDQPFTDKLIIEYQRRCFPSPVPTIAVAPNREDMLKKILPATTYAVLTKKAGQNKATPLTELVRLAETCYLTDQVAQTIMEFMTQNPAPVAASAIPIKQVNESTGIYNFKKTKGPVYVG